MIIEVNISMTSMRHVSPIVTLSSSTASLPRTGECQSPRARAFWKLFKCLIWKKWSTFLERFKAMLYKLQLVAFHKLQITPASAISLKSFVDWLSELCCIVLQGPNIFLFPFYFHFLRCISSQMCTQGMLAGHLQGP